MDRATALEVKLIWGSTVLDAICASDQREITVGDGVITKGVGPFEREVPCDLPAPSRGLPAKRFPIATRRDDGRWAITLHQRFTGRVFHASGAVESLHDIVRSGRVDPGDAINTWRYVLPIGSIAFVEYDALAIQIRAVEREVVHVEKPLELTPWSHALLGATLLHVALIFALLATPRSEEPWREAPFFAAEEPIEIRPTRRLEPRERIDYLAKLKGDPAFGVRRAEGTSGEAPYDSGAKGRRRATPALLETRDEARRTLDRLFAPDAPERRAIFGSGELDRKLDAALGGVAGPVLGDASGTALGTRGAGPGADPAARTVGPGELERSRAIGLPPVEPPKEEPKIHVEEVWVDDPIYREMMGRVVDDHRAQIRHCYERELPQTPTLRGRIVLEWVIDPDGDVRSVRAVSSTLGNAGLERCILDKVRAWPFPAPPAGVTAIVRYPFVLRPADASIRRDPMLR